MKTNRGFTLIELLVVISIIALLSSVTITSLSAARKKAELSADIQNIKSLINANELYKVKTGKYILEDYWWSSNAAILPDHYIQVLVGDSNGSSDFRDALQPLVTEGLISSIPILHKWPNNVGTFMYYAYAPRSKIYLDQEEPAEVIEEFNCNGVSHRQLFFVYTDQDVANLPHLEIRRYVNGVLDQNASGYMLNTYCYGA